MKKRQQKQTATEKAVVLKINSLMREAAKPNAKVIDLPGSRKLAQALEGFNASVDTLTRECVDIGIKMAVKQLTWLGRKIARTR